MYTTVHLNKENKDKLQEIYHNFGSDNITFVCNYGTYSNILFDNTTLPEELINLICVYINDVLVIQVTSYYITSIPTKIKYIYISSADDTYINFTNTSFALVLDEECNIMKNRRHNMYLCEKIRNSGNFSHKHNVYEEASRTIKSFEKVKYAYFYQTDHTLFLTTCYIINAIICSIKQIK